MTTAAAAVRRLTLAAVACAAVLACGARPLCAQSTQAADINREYTIKAAYLYQFGHYVEWPAETFADGQAPLVIGVLRNDALGNLVLDDILKEIARTKSIGGRPIVVAHFPSMAQYTTCHILYVPATAGPDEQAAAIRQVGQSPVLLVGEQPGFAALGGTVNFIVENNKIRFEINTATAARQRLKISSKLLSLAKLVEGPS